MDTKWTMVHLRGKYVKDNHEMIYSLKTVVVFTRERNSLSVSQ